jgi:hypothetical protein
MHIETCIRQGCHAVATHTTANGAYCDEHPCKGPGVWWLPTNYPPGAVDDARALWAVRVLDRWAGLDPKPIVGRSCRGYSIDRLTRPKQWRCRIMGLRPALREYLAATPDASRIAAAEALVAEDPTLGENL